MENRWVYLVILGVFVLISWGVRVALSHRVSGRVFDEDEKVRDE